jgi:hypothetical protein
MGVTGDGSELVGESEGVEVEDEDDLHLPGIKDEPGCRWAYGENLGDVGDEAVAKGSPVPFVAASSAAFRRLR